MKQHSLSPFRLPTCIVLLTLPILISARVRAEEPAADNAATSTHPADGLRFAFDRAPWRDVIHWIAAECDLALQFEDLPPGSFSYSDPNAFTEAEAIDRVNLFLLPQGYTLVRSGQLLSVINLGDTRSLLQLDALARLVRPDALEALPDHEVVKCVFPLGELRAEDAVQELSALKLMTPPEIFARTNRLMITDTARKLQGVKLILDAFQPQTLGNGTVMRTFELQHVTAEDILTVARPHLGLATDEMIGIDVSISADLQGEHIFVTGVEDKVQLIEGLIESLDRPLQTVSTADGETELRTHYVQGGNLEAVYDVLQTLLAGNSLRLSMDKAAGSIVALATPDIQNEIAQTVLQMQATEREFEVIPLKRVDAYYVMSLLEEMLDLPGEYDDPDEIDPDAPKIDADPGNRRLFVRAKPPQIAQIKKIVAGLEAGSPAGEIDLRVLPLSGKQAEELVEIAAKFWRQESPIILLPASSNHPSGATERTVNRPKRGRLTSTVAWNSGEEDVRVLTDNARSQAPAIRCQVTSQGLLLQCDDSSALDDFEAQLRTIAGQASSFPSPPIVFYLKYVKPDDALRMLAELLDGGESAREGEAGSLVNGHVASPGSFLGSIVASRDGTTTMMSGTITVVADARLNRLIAQGTPEDIKSIEGYLEIIDKDKSITSVETYGESHVIELSFASASEVAAAIRDAYAGRVSAATSAGGGGAGANAQDGNQSRERSGDSRDDRAQGKNAGSSSARGRTGIASDDQEPTMTVAVHEPSNSLIVTAPDQLFQEVEQLAKLIDARSEKSVAVVSSANAALLQSVLSPSASSGSRSDRSSSSNRSSRTSLSEALRSRLGR